MSQKKKKLDEIVEEELQIHTEATNSDFISLNIYGYDTHGQKNTIDIDVSSPLDNDDLFEGSLDEFFEEYLPSEGRKIASGDVELLSLDKQEFSEKTLSLIKSLAKKNDIELDIL